MASWSPLPVARAFFIPSVGGGHLGAAEACGPNLPGGAAELAARVSSALSEEFRLDGEAPGTTTDLDCAAPAVPTEGAGAAVGFGSAGDAPGDEGCMGGMDGAAGAGGGPPRPGGGIKNGAPSLR